jgi:hypothetical protein
MVTAGEEHLPSIHSPISSAAVPPPQRPTLLEPLPGPWFPNRGPFSFDPALIPRCPRWWGFFRLAPYRPLAGDATTPITRRGERGVAEATDRFTRIVALRLRGSMAAVHLLLVFQGSLAFRYRGIFRLGSDMERSTHGEVDRLLAGMGRSQESPAATGMGQAAVSAAVPWPNPLSNPLPGFAAFPAVGFEPGRTARRGGDHRYSGRHAAARRAGRQGVSQANDLPAQPPPVGHGCAEL